MLDSSGYDVVTAEHGERAVQVLAQQGVDLVITDYAMPGLTGDEAIRRARSTNRGLAAVIITGHASARSLGSLPDRTVLLNKPFTPAKLLHALKSARAFVRAKEPVR